MARQLSEQLEFENFILPFGGKLRSTNRWVRLAKLIPWEVVDSYYSPSLSTSGLGAPSLSSRVAFGTLFLKEHLKTSDRETVAQIAENPYLQYLLGYESYLEELPFDASMLVHFRKRFGEKLIDLNEQIALRVQAVLAPDPPSPDEPRDSKPPSPLDSSSDPSSKKEESSVPKNQGKLILDATCAPADIAYPTDLNLLNEAREKTEAIMDHLFEPLKGQETKPRNYRKQARKNYLKAAKTKKLSKKKRRKAIGKQLNYLKRNLKLIEELAQRVSLLLLPPDLYRMLLVVTEVSTTKSNV